MKRSYRSNIESLRFLSELMRNDVFMRKVDPIEQNIIYKTIIDLEDMIGRIGNVEKILFGAKND